MVISTKRAIQEPASKVKTLRSAPKQSIVGITKARSDGKVIGRSYVNNNSQDYQLPIKTEQSNVSSNTLNKLLKSRPAGNLSYEDRVVAINQWIENNRSILEDPRYSAEAQKIIQSEKLKLNRIIIRVFLYHLNVELLYNENLQLSAIE
jgi:hypothetical protein